MKKLFCLMMVLALLSGLRLLGLAEAAQPAGALEPGAELDPGAELNLEELDPAGDAGMPPEDAPDPNATPAPDRTVDVDGQFTFVCPGALAPIDIDQQDMTDGLLFSAYSDTMGVDVYKYPQGDDTLRTLYDADEADDSMSEGTLAAGQGLTMRAPAPAAGRRP